MMQALHLPSTSRKWCLLAALVVSMLATAATDVSFAASKSSIDSKLSSADGNPSSTESKPSPAARKRARPRIIPLPKEIPAPMNFYPRNTVGNEGNPNKKEFSVVLLPDNPSDESSSLPKATTGTMTKTSHGGTSYFAYNGDSQRPAVRGRPLPPPPQEDKDTHGHTTASGSGHSSPLNRSLLLIPPIPPTSQLSTTMKSSVPGISPKGAPKTSTVVTTYITPTTLMPSSQTATKTTTITTQPPSSYSPPPFFPPSYPPLSPRPPPSYSPQTSPSGSPSLSDLSRSEKRTRTPLKRSFATVGTPRTPLASTSHTSSDPSQESITTQRSPSPPQNPSAPPTLSGSTTDAGITRVAPLPTISEIISPRQATELAKASDLITLSTVPSQRIYPISPRTNLGGKEKTASDPSSRAKLPISEPRMRHSHPDFLIPPLSDDRQRAASEPNKTKLPTNRSPTAGSPPERDQPVSVHFIALLAAMSVSELSDVKQIALSSAKVVKVDNKGYFTEAMNGLKSLASRFLDGSQLTLDQCHEISAMNDILTSEIAHFAFAKRVLMRAETACANELPADPKPQSTINPNMFDIGLLISIASSYIGGLTTKPSEEDRVYQHALQYHSLVYQIIKKYVTEKITTAAEPHIYVLLSMAVQDPLLLSGDNGSIVSNRLRALLAAKSLDPMEFYDSLMPPAPKLLTKSTPIFESSK